MRRLSARAHRCVRRVAALAVGALVVSMLALGAIAPGAAHEGHVEDDETAAAGPRLPAGFQDRLAITGLDQPTGVAFAPDGAAFLVNQAGIVSTAAFTGGAFGPATRFADLTASVMNYWDRGMTGIAVDPQFGQSAGRDFVYVSYTLNQDPRTGTFPAWGMGGAGSPYYDDCPAPAAAPSTPGCIATMRVSRLEAVRSGGAWVMSGAERVLVTGGCLQFPSHGSGALAFGPDGALYATFGEGASFDFADDGQVANPCGDPVDEGGSLRAQDLRTDADATSLDGTLIRIDAATGAPTSGSTGADTNAKRVVAYGMRNPWRLTFRPGTSEAWIGDVGAGGFDEVNRVTTLGSGSGSAVKPNFGWPCFEGPSPNEQWQALDKPLCRSLYAAQGTAAGATAPAISYARSAEVVPGDDCPTGTASVSGVAFVPTSSSATTYPSAYRGRVVFSDFARGCVWSAPLMSDGSVDRTRTSLFVGEAATPVDVRTGPGGDVYYLEYGLDATGTPTAGAGALHRIVYSAGNQQPTASFTADRTSGAAPLTVTFSSTSTDPDGDALSVAWDLDGDGAYDDGTSASITRTYSTAQDVTVGLSVSDGRGGTSTASRVISAGNTAPVIATMTTNGATWSVAQQVSFAASASDAQQTLAPSDYTWNLVIEHCPSICHSHPLTTLRGTSGTFTTPDHEYPSHLLLKLTVTDGGGLSATRTIQLDPQPVALTFDSDPAGVPLTVGTTSTAPLSRTFIVGSRFTVTAPATWTGPDGFVHQFLGWSDAGAANHDIDAPAAPTTYVARYTLNPAPTPTSTPTPIPTPTPAPLAQAGLRVRSAPGKLRFRVDDESHEGRWKGTCVVGSVVTLRAPKDQWRQGQRWVFVRWSDGGARAHSVTVPAAGLSVKAVYRRA